jgi:prophage antirepressor-like protein
MFWIDGRLWVVAKDVAVALGYSNPREAIRDHCRQARDMNTSDVQAFMGSDSPPVSKRTPLKLIPEADVYRLMARSRLPNAEKFMDWVYEEVIPSVRTHGRYIAPGVDEVLDLDNPDQMVALATTRAIQRLEDHIYNKLVHEVGAKPRDITVVREWMEQRCVRSAGSETLQDLLYQDFLTWVVTEEHHAVSSRMFGMILPRSGIPKFNSRQGLMRVSIALTPEAGSLRSVP